MFFGTIRDLMLADSAQNQCYYLNVMNFVVSSSQYLVPDYYYSLVEKILPNLDLDDMNTVTATSKVYLTIGFIRYLVSFNCSFATTGLLSLDESTLTRPAHKLSNPQIDNNFSAFIDTITKRKVLARIEVIKTLLTILFMKKFDTLNMGIMQQIVGLIFTLDPNEDHGMSSIIQGLHKMVDQLMGNVTCTYPAKDLVTRFFTEQYDKVTSVECSKSLIKLAKLGLAGEITPDVSALVMKMARDTRIPLRDSIDSFLRRDLFSNLSNKSIYGYAKVIFTKIDEAIAVK